MKKVFISFILTVFIIAGIFCKKSTSQNNTNQELSGPYLGQIPPGKTPKVFAPEIISMEVHGGLVFSPDGKEVYWDLMDGKNILFMKLKNKKWTEPAEVSFHSEYKTSDPVFSIDGKKMFFNSTFPLTSTQKDYEEKIWVVERQNNGWSEPRPLNNAVNSLSRIHWQLSVAANGNLYFGADSDVYMAKPVNGEYKLVEKLGTAVNTEFIDQAPYIAPDESYLIFSRHGGDIKYSDLFISFKDGDGNWTEAKNIGEPVNSSGNDICAHVTADGKYLFYNRNHGPNGKLTVFWVSASIIYDLR
ncbi:hypothetical protein ACFL4T_10945 [candidate division KSB1 bacterium]